MRDADSPTVSESKTVTHDPQEPAAGVFTTPVAQAIQHIENAFNAPPQQ